MLWDQGTWTPQTEDVDAALKKGDLKFTLDGYKLKGSWVLVRTRGWGKNAKNDGRSWLLIKHKDDWAGDVDITEFAPRSVKSDADFEDILAEDNPAIWQTNRPAKGGDTGAMLATIIERAAKLKAARSASPAESRAVTSNPKRAKKTAAPAVEPAETPRAAAKSIRSGRKKTPAKRTGKKR